MKINSKTDYNKHRVNSGNGPHRILEMLQEEALKEPVQVLDQINEENVH